MVMSQGRLPFLIQDLERVVLDHFTFLPTALGCDLRIHHGIHVIKAGLGSSMFNIVYGRPQVGGDEVKRLVLGVIDHYEGQPFAWWIGPSQRHEVLSACLVSCGLRQETTEHAMVHHVQESAGYDRDGPLSIHAVTSKVLLQEMCELLDPYDESARLFYARCKDHHLSGSEKLFLGRVGGDVCTMGILYHQGKSAGIFSLITAQNHQGKGYGHHMMRFLMAEAKNLGVQEIFLSASSEAGFRLYERLGFEKIALFDCFEYHPEGIKE